MHPSLKTSRKAVRVVTVASDSISASAAKVDLTSTNAFAEFGVDLSSYQDGKHILALYEGTNSAFGFISASAPGGETLVELITNGDCEAAKPTLDGVALNGYRCTQEQSTDFAHGGSYSIKALSDGTASNNLVGGWYDSQSKFINGALYYYDTYHYIPTGSWNQVSLFYNDGTNSGAITTKDSWVHSTKWANKISAAFAGWRIVTESQANPTGYAVYFDDISIKRMTDCAATGALVTSTKGGATRAWTSNSGINLNNALTYKIFRVY